MSELRRELGVPGAVVTGLGSILGTGVFVSLAIAAGWTSEWLWLVVVAAALLATFNGLSSAQLAAAHPVSGGTYEYGTVYVHPFAGLAAGWLFLVAKSASAATAALGSAAYLLHVTGADPGLRVPVALGIGILLVVVVLSGVSRTTVVNASILIITIGGLIAYIVAGLLEGTAHVATVTVGDESTVSFLTATALVFVAFTGYGRIATLGEEVQEPERTIPIAVIVTLIVSALLYLGVAWVSTRTFAGVRSFASSVDGDAAPLEVIASAWELPWVALAVSIAAVTAMLGVLLNLVLGLSRVVLAMGRRGHLPSGLGKIRDGSPQVAVVAVGAAVVALVLIGDVRTTWSISAVTVLLYYGITNVAALRLPRGQRRFWVWLPWAGLLTCAGLAAFVELNAWLIGVGVAVVGVAVSSVLARRADRT